MKEANLKRLHAAQFQLHDIASGKAKTMGTMKRSVVALMGVMVDKIGKAHRIFRAGEILCVTL